MEIVIKGEAKEIATLALTIQGQQEVNAVKKQGELNFKATVDTSKRGAASHTFTLGDKDIIDMITGMESENNQ